MSRYDEDQMYNSGNSRARNSSRSRSSASRGRTGSSGTRSSASRGTASRGTSARASPDTAPLEPEALLQGEAAAVMAVQAMDEAMERESGDRRMTLKSWP